MNKLVPIIAAASFGIGASAEATTLDFEWFGGTITAEIDANFAGVDMVETFESGSGPVVSFDLPIPVADGFSYSIVFDDGVPSVTSNNLLATLNEPLLFDNGSFSASISGSRASIFYFNSFAGGESTISYANNSYVEDRNQGDIFLAVMGFG